MTLPERPASQLERITQPLLSKLFQDLQHNYPDLRSLALILDCDDASRSNPKPLFVIPKPATVTGSLSRLIYEARAYLHLAEGLSSATIVAAESGATLVRLHRAAAETDSAGSARGHGEGQLPVAGVIVPAAAGVED